MKPLRLKIKLKRPAPPAEEASGASEPEEKQVKKPLTKLRIKMTRSEPAPKKVKTEEPQLAPPPLPEIVEFQVPEDDQLAQAMYAAVSAIQGMDEMRVFAVAPSEEMVPGYRSVIAHPMAFDTIKRKIASGSYATWNPLNSDMQLMFKNCMRFNTDGSIYYQLALQLAGEWRRVYQDAAGRSRAGRRSRKPVKSESDAPLTFNLVEPIQVPIDSVVSTTLHRRYVGALYAEDFVTAGGMVPMESRELADRFYPLPNKKSGEEQGARVIHHSFVHRGLPGIVASVPAAPAKMTHVSPALVLPDVWERQRAQVEKWEQQGLARATPALRSLFSLPSDGQQRLQQMLANTPAPELPYESADNSLLWAQYKLLTELMASELAGQRNSPEHANRVRIFKATLLETEAQLPLAYNWSNIKRK